MSPSLCSCPRKARPHPQADLMPSCVIWAAARHATPRVSLRPPGEVPVGGGISLQGPAPGCVQGLEMPLFLPSFKPFWRLHLVACLPWNHIALSDSLLGQCLGRVAPSRVAHKRNIFFVTLCLPHNPIPDLGYSTWVRSHAASSVPGLGLEQQPASPLVGRPVGPA